MPMTDMLNPMLFICCYQCFLLGWGPVRMASESIGLDIGAESVVALNMNE